MAKKSSCRCKSHECEECPEWIFTFADLVMLMMGFFVILWVLKPTSPQKPTPQNAIAQTDEWLETVGEIRGGFGWEPNAKSPDAVDQAVIRKRARNGAGLKFFDARRKKQMVDMLHTAAGETVVTITNLLRDADNEKGTALNRLVKSLQFTKHAQKQIQQAGLTWSSTRPVSRTSRITLPYWAGSLNKEEKSCCTRGCPELWPRSSSKAGLMASNRSKALSLKIP